MTAAEIHQDREGLKQLPRQGDIVSGGPPQIRVIQRSTGEPDAVAEGVTTQAKAGNPQTGDR